MTNTQLKTQIDAQITNKNTPNSLTPINVGVNIKDLVNKVGFNSYLAIISQSSTNAPTIVTEIKNDLDTIISFTYIGVGEYHINASSNVFTNNKTVCSLVPSTNHPRIVATSPLSVNIIELKTLTALNPNVLANTISQAVLEIRVYD